MFIVHDTLYHIIGLVELLQNALFHIVVTESGIVISVKLLFSKADTQIEVTESGIVTLVIHFELNALAQMLVILVPSIVLGTSTLSPHHVS